MTYIEEIQKEKADKIQVEQAMQDVRAQIAAFTVSRLLTWGCSTHCCSTTSSDSSA